MFLQVPEVPLPDENEYAASVSSGTSSEYIIEVEMLPPEQPLLK
jgi:hypothetical protein